MSRRRKVAQVALGIFASRVSGLVRVKVLAHVFGVGALADVWTFALRGPNVLQNLLGEQALSASFIPLYVRKLARDEEEARRFAGAVLSLLLFVLAVLVLAGVLLAGPLVAVLNPGLLGDAARVAAGAAEVDRYPLAVAAVRILLPMTGVLVISAWCLGILNSHDRFFLSYVAPVLWNAGILGAVLLATDVLTRAPGAGVDGRAVLMAACWGALGGSLLQLLVQLPVVLGLSRRLRLRSPWGTPGVSEMLRRFAPALAGRSAAQLSGYVDLFLAGFLAVGSLAALAWAQTLYLLPVALFGLSTAAVELPRLSRQSREDLGATRARLGESFAQMSFLTVPALVGYLLFGRLVVGLLYEGGSFGRADAGLVAIVLAVYSVGLLATTTSRLLQSLFFALGDTGSPARVAFGRLAVAAVAGAAFGLTLDRFPVAELGFLGAEASTLSLGAAGLAVGSALSAWFEMGLLLRLLRSRVPELSLPWREVSNDLRHALVAAVPAGLLWWGLAGRGVWVSGPPVLVCFGVAYGGLALRSGSPEARALWRALRRR